jgi:transcriptional regulator with XRE-family HTH domain
LPVVDDFFHNNIRRARERAGLSQTELAECLGVVRSTINDLECGRTNLFNKNIPAIARRLGISVEELLCGAPPEQLLEDPFTRTERENALRKDLEGRISALQEQLDTEKRISHNLQTSLDSLTRSHNFLLDQLRKEQ